ncbi:MAG: MBL fold metallo-hydrolase [Actinobacteria bacterium]|nr:MBL fold metallo-hydrolase [Actinomycetota bacterium]
MAIREIAPKVYAVGVVDWTLRDFHGFVTSRGVTYNSYLIVDEKITLIDAVKHTLVDELLQNVSSIVEPTKIDYVVSNHAEPDHSSGLPQVMKEMPQATVVCTAKCQATFNNYYQGDWKYKIVKTADTLSVGKKDLHFVATPMVHWPDSMVTYLPAEKILFSMDAFGQHIANSQLYDDELPLDLIMDEARRYYANIITPLGSLVLKTLAAAEGLDIETIPEPRGDVAQTYSGYCRSLQKMGLVEVRC